MAHSHEEGESPKLVVGLAGATGALGKEVLAVLDRAPWRPTEVVPFASAASTTPFVPWGEGQRAVDDLAQADLAELDLLICALPADVAEETVAEALNEDVPVVDCSLASASDPQVPAVLPWVNPESLAEPPLHVRIPSAPAALLASALGPLARAGAHGTARATILLPASHWGRGGIDELSRQVTALFNAGTPPRRVFAGGLAFDLVPQVGVVGDAGWTDVEVQIAEEAIVVAGWEGTLHVTVVGVPVFSGVSIQLEIQPSRSVPPELARQILVDGGMRMTEGEGARSVPRPRRVEGQPLPMVDRIRVDEGGALHLWLAADNLRMSAAVAVATGGVLIRQHRR